MAHESSRRVGHGFLMTAAALTVVIAGLYYAGTFLVPLLTALFLAVISYPAVRWLGERARVPPAIGVILVLLAQMLLLGAIFTYVGKSVTKLGDLNQKLTARMEEVKDLKAVQWLDETIGSGSDQEDDSPETADPADPVGDGAGADAAPDAAGGPKKPEGSALSATIDGALAFIKDNTTGLVKSAADLMSQAFLVIMTMVFLLMEAGTVQGKIQRAAGSDGTSDRLRLVVRQVQSYLVVKTLTSLVTGICAAVLLWTIGIEEPVLWGFLAFLLNYIPTIGSILAAIPPVMLAFLQGFGTMGLVAGGYATINILIGNVLEPMMMGRKMGLSPLIVFLSMVFWNLIWGPVGMILSVPLTMTVKIFLENSDRGRVAAILMGTEEGPVGDANTGSG